MKNEFDNALENFTQDIYSKLLTIGNAMFAYYEGKELSQEQIELIANSSNEAKIMGMNCVADIRLQFEEGSNSIYKTNTDAILATRRKLKMRK